VALLVGADGGQSAVRREAGIEWEPQHRFALPAGLDEGLL
jgi:2-polyprenyl-6-methoxyphenol hydroxylase-like FAD-dependent oxidoreductase